MLFLQRNRRISAFKLIYATSFFTESAYLLTRVILPLDAYHICMLQCVCYGLFGNHKTRSCMVSTIDTPLADNYKAVAHTSRD